MKPPVRYSRTRIPDWEKELKPVVLFSYPVGSFVKLTWVCSFEVVIKYSVVLPAVASGGGAAGGGNGGK